MVAHPLPATPTVVEEQCEVCVCHCLVHVHPRAHHHGALAAQLQRAGLQAGSNLGRDLAANLSAASERNLGGGSRDAQVVCWWGWGWGAAVAAAGERQKITQLKANLQYYTYTRTCTNGRPLLINLSNPFCPARVLTLLGLPPLRPKTSPLYHLVHCWVCDQCCSCCGSVAADDVQHTRGETWQQWAAAAGKAVVAHVAAAAGA